MRFLFFISFCILFPYSLKAQYEWTTYSNGGNLADAINCIEIVSDNEIWVGTLDNGVQLFNGHSYMAYNTKNSPLPGDRIYDIFIDSEDRKWIATLNGLAILDNNEWSVYTPENSNLPGKTVISIVQEKQGRIWLGTDEGVVADLFGTVYNSDNSGLPGNLVTEMYIDDEGLIWIATDKGIASFDGNTWSSHISGTGILPQELVRAIEIDKYNNLWASFIFGSDGALLVFDGQNWEFVEPEGGFLEGVGVYDIISTDKGEVWFSTHHKGLIKYNGTNFEHFLVSNSDIPINQILSLAVDSSGYVWMGSRKGLTKVISSPTSNLNPSEETNVLQVTPNPFKYFTEISVPEEIERPYSFSLYNANGRQVRLMNEIHSESFILRNEGFEAGLYFYKILSGSEQLTGKLFVID